MTALMCLVQTPHSGEGNSGPMKADQSIMSSHELTYRAWEGEEKAGFLTGQENKCREDRTGPILVATVLTMGSI